MTGIAAILRLMNVRHLLHRKLRTGLTVTGVAAGVALVFSIAIINATLLSSFRASLRALAGSAELEVAAADQAGIPQAWIEDVAAVPGVEHAIPIIRTTTELAGDDGRMRVLVVGVTPEFTTLFPEDLGELGNVQIRGGFGGPRDVLLSTTVADAVGGEPGERVDLETPEGTRGVEVSGTVSGGALAAFNGGAVAILTLEGAQDVFAKPERVDSIFVITESDASLDQVTTELERTTSGGAIVGPPGERGRGLERVFGGLGTLLSMAGTVSLLVALFIVYNTMSMSLAERRKEISMALAMGATRVQVFGAFLAEAFVFGVVATVGGIVAGLGLARILVQRAAASYEIFATDVGGPLVVTGFHVVVAVVGGIGIALLGAYLPARRVMSVAPIEALRPDAAYEWAPPSDARARSALRLGVGFLGLAIGTVCFILSGSNPDAEWIVQLGLVGGFLGVTLLLPTIVPVGIRILRPVLARWFGTVGRLATDALEKNPGRTTFTAAALVLTLGLVIAVASALGSYQSQVERMANAIIGAPIYVSARSFTGVVSDQPLEADLATTIEEVPGVDHVYPIRSVFLNVEGEQGLMFAIDVKEAVARGASSDISAMTNDPDAFLDGLERGGVAIARGTSVRHDVGIGDGLRLRTPSGGRSFEVIAIYNDLVSFDALYIDHGVYQRYWHDDKVDQFGVLTAPGASVDTVRDDLRVALERVDAPARVLRKEELVGQLLETIEGTFSLGQGIQLAALIVAAITVANTMFTAVLERRWEMGLQRALGMGSRQLRGSVILEAAGIGIIGGIGGAVLGTIAGFMMMKSMEAQFQWDIQFQIPYVMWIAGILGGAVLAALVGSGPSRGATRVSIIESLRYE